MTSPNTQPVAVPRYEKLRSYVAAVLQPKDFVLIGSATLAARGIRDVNDLDVLVRPSRWVLVKAKFAEGYWPAASSDAEVPEYDPDLDADGKPREILRTGQHDFMMTPPRIVGAVTAADVFQDAQYFEGFQVGSPRHCLAIKALAGRKKDHADMTSLAALIALEESEEHSLSVPCPF